MMPASDDSPVLATRYQLVTYQVACAPHCRNLFAADVQPHAYLAALCCENGRGESACLLPQSWNAPLHHVPDRVERWTEHSGRCGAGEMPVVSCNASNSSSRPLTR